MFWLLIGIWIHSGQKMIRNVSITCLYCDKLITMLVITKIFVTVIFVNEMIWRDGDRVKGGDKNSVVHDAATGLGLQPPVRPVAQKTTLGRTVVTITTWKIIARFFQSILQIWTSLGPCHTRHFDTQYCDKKICW